MYTQRYLYNNIFRTIFRPQIRYAEVEGNTVDRAKKLQGGSRNTGERLEIAGGYHSETDRRFPHPARTEKQYREGGLLDRTSLLVLVVYN